MTRFPLLSRTGCTATCFARRLRLRQSLALVPVLALAAGFLASGCTSTPESKKRPPGSQPPQDGPMGPGEEGEEPDEVPIDLFTDDDRYTGIPEDKLTFRDISDSSHTKDSDVNFDSSDKANFDAFEVAQWVKSRRAAIDWCTSQKKTGQDWVYNDHGGNETSPYKKVFPDDPRRDVTRLDQALSIALRIVEKVPDTPEARLRLAQMCFVKGAYHYWVIDAGMYTVIDAEDKGDEASRKKAEKIRVRLEWHRKRMIAYHLLSLKQFQYYEAALPLPGNHPVDYYFKINFQLGNIPEALKYLSEILDNPDLKPEVRAKYEPIEQKIKDWIALSRIDASAPKPGSPEAIRKDGARQHEALRDDPGVGETPRH